METCNYCHTKFDCDNRKKNYNLKNGYKLFCSYDCYSKSRDTRIECECCTCGKKILRRPTQIKKSKTGNVYCSASCAVTKNNTLFKSGENHPNYENGSGSYRSRALKTKGSECDDCKINDLDVLEVHHIDENRSNNHLKNLIVLCANCHLKRHKKKKRE